MFCSSRDNNNNNKSLFCAEGGQEEVDNDYNNGAPRRNGNFKGMAILRNHDETNNNGGSGGGRGILDEVVISALKNLHFEDIQRNLHEQHGVQDHHHHFDKSPDFVANKLEELEAQLNKQLKQKIEMSYSFLWSSAPSSVSSSSSSPSPLSSPSPPGILLAQSMDPNFVQNTYRLRLRVLRAEFYDAAKAATRMIRYFDLKQEVFGPERINKTIGFEDLSRQDVDALNKGFFQYIQGRDAVGRRMFAFFPHIVEHQDPKSLPRLFFYYDTFVNQNEFDKGYILLAFHLGPPSKDALDIQNRAVWLKELMIGYPDSPSAIHDCFYPNHTHLYFVKAVFLLMPPDVRAKIKIHVGSQTEWLYELMSYGISQQLVPISSSGEIKFKQHQNFIDYRKKLGEFCSINPSYWKSAIEIPNNDDVLLVRGRPFQNHRGNGRLHSAVEENTARYISCNNNRSERTKVIADVIKEVKSIRGIRFLIQDHRSLLWMEADDVTVEEKVYQMFRNELKKVAASTTLNSTKRRTPIPGASHPLLGDTNDLCGVTLCHRKHDEKEQKASSYTQEDSNERVVGGSMKRPRLYPI